MINLFLNHMLVIIDGRSIIETGTPRLLISMPKQNYVLLIQFEIYFLFVTYSLLIDPCYMHNEPCDQKSI